MLSFLFGGQAKGNIVPYSEIRDIFHLEHPGFGRDYSRLNIGAEARMKIWRTCPLWARPGVYTFQANPDDWRQVAIFGGSVKHPTSAYIAYCQYRSVFKHDLLSIQIVDRSCNSSQDCLPAAFGMKGEIMKNGMFRVICMESAEYEEKRPVGIHAHCLDAETIRQGLYFAELCARQIVLGSPMTPADNKQRAFTTDFSARNPWVACLQP